MSKPLDAVGKELLAMDPPAWAAFLGVPRPPGTTSLVDSDLSTVTAAGDKILLIRDDLPWILDVEFQSWSDTKAPRQLLKYNALLHDGHELPVASVLVVLGPSANSTVYTGEYRLTPPFGPAWEFRYTVVKVWETSADVFLNGPLALTPLAPVADLGAGELRDVFHRVIERETREADPETANRMLTAAGVLLNMRYGKMTTNDLLSRYPEIREMDFFKFFIDDGLARGRVEHARSVVLRVGRKKFGPPSPQHEAALSAVADLARLETLEERLLDVNTWDELLKAD